MGSNISQYLPAPEKPKTGKQVNGQWAHECLSKRFICRQCLSSNQAFTHSYKSSLSYTVSMDYLFVCEHCLQSGFISMLEAGKCYRLNCYVCRESGLFVKLIDKAGLRIFYPFISSNGLVSK